MNADQLHKIRVAAERAIEARKKALATTVGRRSHMDYAALCAEHDMLHVIRQSVDNQSLPGGILALCRAAEGRK